MKRLAILLMAAVLAPSAHAGDDGAPGEGEIKIVLSKDLELRTFLDGMATATGRAVLFDPNGQRIRGQKIGVDLEFSVPQSRLFDAYRALLSFYELTLVPIGPLGYEIYLAVDSRSTNNFVKNKAQSVSADQIAEYRDRDGLFITVFFPLSNVRNMTTVRTALSTMVTPAGIGRVQEIPEVGIIVMDFAPTVYGISQILKLIDVPSPSTQVLEMIALDGANAGEVARALQELWTESVTTPPQPSRTRRGLRTPGAPPRIVPYQPRNAIVVRSTRAELEVIRALVTKLDHAPEAVTVEVVRLKHVRAHLLATTLTATMNAPTSLSPAGAIVPDMESNSIVISGPRRTLAAIKDIIAALDLPPLKPESAK